MKFLSTIQDADFGINTLQTGRENYKKRNAARAVIFDDERKIALLRVSGRNYYKLPGGGLEGNEDIEEGLSRECLEEAGCKIKNLQEIGIIEEFRGKWSLHQISHCFLAEVDGEKQSPEFTEKETAEGFELIWVDSLDKATQLVGLNQSGDYEVNFMQKRDLIILATAAKKF